MVTTQATLFFTSKRFGPSADEIFGFIWQNVSFKDTLLCRSSIHSRYRPHRP
ncbi:MAG: hypothetical protein RLZZ214_2475 [Verrucomicrobiota bacterium]